MKPEVFKRFYNGKEGVAAIEAALLFPLLILILLGAIELVSVLDSRRVVNNASFSLANTAATLGTVDANNRTLLTRGHNAILAKASLSGTRTVLKGYERFPNGTYNEIWSWSPGQGGVNMTNQQINVALQGNIGVGEGMVVAIVEAEHASLVSGIFPAFGKFQGFHAQVPTKTSVPIYR